MQRNFLCHKIITLKSWEREISWTGKAKPTMKQIQKGGTSNSKICSYTCQEWSSPTLKQNMTWFKKKKRENSYKTILSFCHIKSALKTWNLFHMRISSQTNKPKVGKTLTSGHHRNTQIWCVDNWKDKIKIIFFLKNNRTIQLSSHTFKSIGIVILESNKKKITQTQYNLIKLPNQSHISYS